MKRNRNGRLLALLAAGGILLAGCGRDAQTSAEINGWQPAEDRTSQKDTGQADTDAGDDAAEDMDDAIDIEGTVIGAGKTELDGGIVKITAGGTYELSGSGAMVVVDAKGQDVKLVLDDVSLDNEDGPGIYVKKAESLTMELKGENSVTSGTCADYEALNAAIYSKADLKIEGSGSLTVNASYGHGIKAKDSAEFNADLDIKAATDGIHVNDAASFTGGSYKITADSEGIESKDVLEISGGTFDVEAVDDALNAASSLVISCGTLDLVSGTNDAVDSNGTLEISGGTITAVALRAPETAFDVDNTPFILSGGTLFGAGTQATLPTEASQPLLLVGGSGSVSSVKVEKDGETILEGDLAGPSNQTVLFLSCPKMQAGDTVTVTVNGSTSQEVTLDEGVSTVGNVQTMGGGKGGLANGGPGGRGGMMNGAPGGLPAPDSQMQP